MEAQDEVARERPSSNMPLTFLLIALTSVFMIVSQGQVVTRVSLMRRSSESSSATAPKRSTIKSVSAAVASLHLPASSNVDRAETPSQTEILVQERRINISSAYQNQWPPLSELIDDKETSVVSDVQFLVDFAIVGHPKTGTSSLMRLLSTHPQVQMHQQEIRSLRKGKPAEFVSKMYELPHGSQYKRGFKSPNEICTLRSLQSICMHFPDTRLIVGVRHPVKWFESWYNFQSRQGREQSPAEKLVGPDLPYQVQYHRNLAMLGKTNPKRDPVEAALLRIDKDMRRRAYRPMRNKVFLYDSSQPFDSNETRAELFRNDLSDFIGLSTPFAPPRTRLRESRNTHYAIDICDDKFTNLRAELIENGKEDANWIQTYFMVHPHVTVSSPEYFKQAISTWKDDPCDDDKS